MGATTLAKALETNFLLGLDVSHNQIGHIGATALAKGLEKCSFLEELDIKYNQIGDVGGAALAKILDSNSSLISLDGSTNKIGNIGATALVNIKALESNSSLGWLYFSNNPIVIGDIVIGTMVLAKALEFC